MDNQKAIEILNNYHNGYFGYKIADVKEAHELAIKALKLYPCTLHDANRISGKDSKMIYSMAFIKSYCKDINECLNCPMYDNCHSSDDNKRFPYFWYIPEV